MKCWLKALAAANLFGLACAALCQESDAKDVVGLTRKILSDPEFSDERAPSALDNLLERVQETIGEILRAIFGDRTEGAAPFLGQIIVAVFLGALLVLAVWLISTIRWSGRTKVKSVGYVDERKAPSHELIRLSDEAYAAGDYNRAFTLAFWAFLKLADAAGVLDYSDDATNWEILRTMKVSDLSVPAREFATNFDLIEYGNGQASHQDFLAVRDLIEKIPTKVAA